MTRYPRSPRWAAAAAEISTNNGAAPDTPYDAIVLAANYTDQDLGSPALASNAVYNPDTGLWSITASGTGIGGSSDQFNFAATTINGNGTYFAKATSQTNSNAAAAAGVMFRDSTDTATSAFAAVFVTPRDGVEFEWRVSNGAAAATPIAITGIVAPIWVELVRSGSTFTASYSSNGTTWTQIGTSQTVTMSTSALAGLAVSANSSSATTTAGFSNLAGPSITTAPAASPQPATGTTANLSITATETGSTLTYTWSIISSPTGSTNPTFSVNGTSAAKNTTATFSSFGVYFFLVTITDSNNVSTTDVLGVGVNETATSVAVSPTSVTLGAIGTQIFTASATDQFGVTFQPVFAWSLSSGIGAQNSSFGLYTAPAATGSATVRAAVSTASGTASVTIVGPVVSTPAAANPNPVVTGTTTVLTAAGTQNGSSSGLTYTWAATTIPMGAATPLFSANGTSAAKNSTATFSQAGTYAFTVTIEDSSGLTVTSTTPNVIVNQTLTTIAVTSPSPVVGSTASLQFSASAIDQFGNAIAASTFAWSATGSSNSINSAGLFDAGSTSGPFSVQAAIGSVTGTAAVTVVPIVYSNPGTYYVALTADQSTEQIWIGSSDVGSPTWSVPITLLPSLTFNGGPDNLTVDFTNGDSIPQGGLTFTGNSGTNSLSIIGTSGNDSVNVGSATVTFDSDTPISYSNLQSITINGGMGADVFTQSAQPGSSAALNFLPTSTDTLNINAGLYSIPAPVAGSGIDVYPLSQMNIADGTSVALQTAPVSSDRTVLVLNNLAISSTAQLDLGGNDMIDHSDGLSHVNGLIVSGFNAGGSFWTGDGITSSLAAYTPDMALGIELNNTKPDGTGSTIVSIFDGVSVGIADVLVKYTHFGDADPDGTVTATDYLAIDNGFNADGMLSSWQNGDFNYDGQINGDDYTLIDNTFNTQAATDPLNDPIPAEVISDILPARASAASQPLSVIRPPAINLAAPQMVQTSEFPEHSLILSVLAAEANQYQSTDFAFNEKDNVV